MTKQTLILHILVYQIETRSRCQSQTPQRWKEFGFGNALKDVSNALTTSKELLRIINRMWVQEDNKPSSSVSLISALHAELERARLQVNQFAHEQRSDQNEIHYILQCFAEEKAAWKNREKESIRAAIESVVGELEIERKLRRRIESLNKKLGKELGETKMLFSKAMKVLENEKRARGIIEQVCDDLAWNVGEDKAKVEDWKRESLRMREEIEKEREMLNIADALREERAQMKLSEAKHHFEEKNAVVDQLRGELETFLKDERGMRRRFGRDEEKEVDDGEVEDDMHSIELSMNRLSKGYKPGFGSVTHRRSTSLARSVSNVVENLQSATDGELGFGYERFSEAHRRSCGDDLQRSKMVKGLREHVLSSSRLGPRRIRQEDARVDSKNGRRSRH